LREALAALASGEVAAIAAMRIAACVQIAVDSMRTIRKARQGCRARLQKFARSAMPTAQAPHLPGVFDPGDSETM